MSAPRRSTQRDVHPEYRKHACYSGENLADPNRADRLLRKFSWQTEKPEDGEAREAP